MIAVVVDVNGLRQGVGARSELGETTRGPACGSKQAPAHFTFASSGSMSFDFPMTRIPRWPPRRKPRRPSIWGDGKTYLSSTTTRVKPTMYDSQRSPPLSITELTMSG
jgi:hypothetical protein